MAEYIDKAKAVENIKKLMSSMPAKDNYAKGYDAAIGRTLIAIREVSAVNVQPAERGKWIWDSNAPHREHGAYKCSNCGCHSDFEENYCYNCGAKMEGGNEDENS